MFLTARARRAAAELARRAGKRAFDPAALCFDKQLHLVTSPAKRKVARCSRRAGKTHGTAVLLLTGALSEPFANQMYVTMSLKNAKRLVWPTIKKMNRAYGLGGEVNDTEAFIHFPNLPNDPHIFLGGAKDQGEIDKLRGYEGGIKRFVLDEAQGIRQGIVKELVDDVAEPQLFDYDGELVAIGTPGPVRAGYFYDIDVGEQAGGWEHFRWTMLDNPHLAKKSGKPTEQLIAELLKRRGWTRDHPTFLREYCGEWHDDEDARVFKYDPVRNAAVQVAAPMRFVIGFDMGHDDADAIAVLGWTENDPTVHLVYEETAAGQGVTELAESLRRLRDLYRPIAMVGDFGGLGKKIGEEIRRRFGLPVEAADKQRKLEHIELLNDALRSGRFRAPVDGSFAQDTQRLVWDTDARAKGVLKVDDAFHSDITDAVLYGYRSCLGWLSKPVPVRDRLDPGEEERRQLEREKREAEERRRRPMRSGRGRARALLA